jgi:hypothetical protein
MENGEWRIGVRQPILNSKAPAGMKKHRNADFY